MLKCAGWLACLLAVSSGTRPRKLRSFYLKARKQASKRKHVDSTKKRPVASSRLMGSVGGVWFWVLPFLSSVASRMGMTQCLGMDGLMDGRAGLGELPWVRLVGSVGSTAS
ncbi:uncharacterized protein J3D65DRAFT_633480 [Phyllosticta citribraziliensis]|uniref:Secreted protein n=1 Tax=Phyllosticta citribraziliensis TaxID=989973 RepID=A0ABR1LDT3_9PEZI